MSRYLSLRLARALATAAGVVSFAFLLLRLVPGDPVDALLPEHAPAADRAAVRHELHLDEPLLQQYLRFLGDVGDGSLGHSFRKPTRTVWSLAVEVLPATVELAVAALSVAVLLAVPLGVLAASLRGQFLDRLASAVSLFGLAMPAIWLGPLLILTFCVLLRVLPMPGDDSRGALALILPALTVGGALSGVLTRQTRAAMLEVLTQPYVNAARARGLTRTSVLFKHALRNALLPIFTVLAAQLGALLSGAVIAEKIFERPGLGTLFLEAFFARDFPVVQGVVLIVGLSYVAVNLALDLAYALIDPRVRLG